MKLKKLGHCCLVIEEQGVRFMTDPGNLSTAQDAEKGIDCVVITHEHADHLHMESLKAVLANNPNAVVVSNGAVGSILAKESVPFTKIADGESGNVGGVVITGHGTRHAEIYREFGQVENTGYFLNGKLFYPGDAFYDPGMPVDILALPIAGPWCKISEALDYAKAVKPRVAFPVHDGGLRSGMLTDRLAGLFLPEAGIRFDALAAGSEAEF